jgi:hypothetical protein
VYAKYSDWAHWFWKGAVHINDVATAVILSLDLLSRRQLDRQLILTLDSAYEYTGADLDHWDAEGPGSTFRKYYPGYYDLALSYGLDPALKPTRLDISETVRWLGYKPAYSLANLLARHLTTRSVRPAARETGPFCFVVIIAIKYLTIRHDMLE